MEVSKIDKEKLDKNFTQIIKETNKYLKKYKYNQNKIDISVEISYDGDIYSFCILPRYVTWSEYRLDWNEQGDIFLKNESNNTEVKIVSQHYLYNDTPELIVHELFQDLIEERDYISKEVKDYEERDELEYECYRSED